ncbi:hypothetical protein PENARI_c012G11322 [Penicillium arizonense]|uniref:FCP1 homology domain-containing protein n=1 Tax=Penicillium arizonense TaxID=1835702 RepID=A0A1F5LF94_PENAI|nr:hypothetical protein PENARI_c012G11322 [Penicillium arizonense]OGE51680.1 hypothetical protein PENARI_c012G11322 [Penicillium arizonense]
MATDNPGPANPEFSEQARTTDATETQDATAVAPSDAAPSAATSSAPAVEAAETPKRRLLSIPIPSRRSSKTNKQIPPEKTEEAQDEPTRRSSKVSILRAKRDPSRASSRRSRRTQDVANGEESKGAAAPESTPKLQPKKSPSKLLAFLGCCSSADVDTDDTTVPPKKTNRQQPASNRLPTPDKADAHTGDSSTAESREPYFDEKAHSTVSADQPGEEERNVHANATGAQSEGPSAAVQSEASGQNSEPEVSAPVESAGANGSVDESKPEESTQDLETQTKSIEEPAPSTAPTKSLVDDDQPEPVNQADIVTQAPMVLPPPPPVPAPPARAVSEDGIRPLLPAPLPHLSGRKCLVLDLDETLVHSSFKVLERADFTIPVEIEGQYHNIYVIKRPGVDQFMKRVGELYEVVVFTASVSKYGDPLLDQLDIHNVVHHRLFRESCYNHQGNYVKDLSQVGRDLKETIIIDNSPTSYIFHPEHAIPISSWFSDAHDNELLDLIPVLEDLAGTQVQDVSMVLDCTL